MSVKAIAALLADRLMGNEYNRNPTSRNTREARLKLILSTLDEVLGDEHKQIDQLTASMISSCLCQIV